MGDDPTRRSRDYDGLGMLSALRSAGCRTRRDSHKKAQKGTKRERITEQGPVFWSAGLLPRILTFGKLQAAKLSAQPPPCSFKYLTSVFCAAWLLMSSVLSAAAWCTIDVEVRDASAEVVADVMVHAEASLFFESRHQETGPDGSAVLLGLPAGTYRMEITREGYQWLEVQDVRCEPGRVVRLAVTLERTEGDEIVILPSGPSVDSESTVIGHLQSREASRLLPVSVTDGLAGARLGQVEATGFEGVLRAGNAEQPGPRMVVVPRRAERIFHGQVAIDIGGSLQARPTGTRGDVTGIDDVMRLQISLGGFPVADRLGTFVALETEAAGLDSQVVFGDGASGEDVHQRRQWDQKSILAYGAIDWMAAPNHRIDLRLNWDRRRQQRMASSLHVVPENPLPGGDADDSSYGIGLEWHALVSDALFLRVAGRLSDTNDQWRPTNTGPLRQDQSPDGSWSAGLGNGVWAGDGGVAAFDQAVDDVFAEGGLEWSVASGHRLAIETSWRREDRDLQYSGSVDSVGLGLRRTYRGSIAERRDALIPSGDSRGLEEVRRMVIRDTWRVGPGLTLIFGLAMTDLRFDAGENRASYHFTVDDTLSPHVGLVWDFDKEGRSRAWVNWARFRQAPGEAVKWRLTGALDVETLFIDDDGSSRERSPGDVSVASDLEPSVIDETVFGVEYELLSHLVVGAAGIIRLSERGLAILTEDGGWTLNLDTPSGEMWSEGLDSEVYESWAWVRKRLANGWQAEMRVGWRRSRGAWFGPQDFNLADLDREYLSDVFSPAALEGAWGPLPDDRRWRGEVSGSWFFDAGPSLGGRLSYRSGAPVSRLGALADGLGLDRRFTENRGSAGRTPELWRLDLVGSWPFALGKGRLEAFAELSNILNSQSAISLDERWTLLDEDQVAGLESHEPQTAGTWGEPLVVQKPMEIRVGLAYRW